jgi:hypothetical protein
MAMQDGQGAMLDGWQENFAIMVANRTQGDERVMLHLGDRLWGVRGEVGVIHGLCICWWDGREGCGGSDVLTHGLFTVTGSRCAFVLCGCGCEFRAVLWKRKAVCDWCGSCE